MKPTHLRSIAASLQLYLIPFILIIAPSLSRAGETPIQEIFQGFIYEVNGPANCRMGPTSNDKIVESLPNRSFVYVKAKKGDWFEVAFGRTCWTSKQNIGPRMSWGPRKNNKITKNELIVRMISFLSKEGFDSLSTSRSCRVQMKDTGNTTTLSIVSNDFKEEYASIALDSGADLLYPPGPHDDDGGEIYGMSKRPNGDVPYIQVHNAGGSSGIDIGIRHKAKIIKNGSCSN